MAALQVMQLPVRWHSDADDKPMDLDEPMTTLCYLLSLPGELRNQIYHLLLTSPLVPMLRRLVVNQNHKSDSTLVRLPICTSILSTCKQINVEATPMLYSLNTFAASSSRLTSLPFLVNPARPITCPGMYTRIKRWYIHVRLECDPQFCSEDVTKAFSGAEELEIEASQSMFRGAGMGVLQLFKSIRGVGRAKVTGSVQPDFAAWLETCMMGDYGDEFEEFDDGVEKIWVNGVWRPVNIWDLNR